MFIVDNSYLEIFILITIKIRIFKISENKAFKKKTKKKFFFITFHLFCFDFGVSYGTMLQKIYEY